MKRTATAWVKIVSSFVCLFAFSARAQTSDPSAEFFKPREVSFQNIPWHADRWVQGLKTMKLAPELLYLTIRSEHELTEFVTLTQSISELEGPVYEYLGFSELDEDGLPSDESIRRWTTELKAWELRLESQSAYVLVPVRGKPEYRAYRVGPHQKNAPGFTNFGDLLRRAFKEEGIDAERAQPQSSVGQLKSALKNGQHFFYRGVRGNQPIVEFEAPENLMEDAFLDEFNLIKKQAQTTGLLLQIRFNSAFTSETLIQPDSIRLLEKIVAGCSSAFTRHE